MNNITEQALREFEDAADRKDPEYILEIQKNVLSCQVRKQKRLGKKLKNPVHYRTGKPLKEITLKKYQASLEGTKELLAAIELAIEMLRKYGLLGNGRKSINEVLASYEGGKIPKEDKPWIEALRHVRRGFEEREAKRERILSQLRTCQRDCVFKDLWENSWDD